MRAEERRRKKEGGESHSVIYDTNILSHPQSDPSHLTLSPLYFPSPLHCRIISTDTALYLVSSAVRQVTRCTNILVFSNSTMTTAKTTTTNLGSDMNY